MTRKVDQILVIHSKALVSILFPKSLTSTKHLQKIEKKKLFVSFISKTTHFRTYSDSQGKLIELKTSCISVTGWLKTCLVYVFKTPCIFVPLGRNFDTCFKNIRVAIKMILHIPTICYLKTITQPLGFMCVTWDNFLETLQINKDKKFNTIQLLNEQLEVITVIRLCKIYQPLHL